MNDSELNTVLVAAVLKAIPEQMNPSNYIMEVLNLSRESVYRRIRQEIPFSVDELVTLSLKLGFSIDEVVEGNRKESFSFELQSKKKKGTANEYISSLQNYNFYLENFIHAKDAKALLTINEVPMFFYALTDELFKFNYYMWLISNAGIVSPCSYSSFVVPNVLLAMQEEIRNNIKQVNNVIIVLSPTIYFNFIKAIQYYYRCKLLTQEELIILIKAMKEWIDFGEYLLHEGFPMADSAVDFYLSSLAINSSSYYLYINGKTETHLWIYPNNPLIIKDQEICAIQKHQFMLHKQQSSLISQSNSIIQRAFFEKQQEYLEEYLVNELDSTVKPVFALSGTELRSF